ncbi:MAG: glycoside hydrolase family 1 protein [Coriobacteriia bacterium]|nr:glycoside hydrolase family 1 protein [Coriobacteriia bacterium]
MAPREDGVTELLRFPDDFLWGSGISAHQCEGGNRHNDWWAFEEQGKVAGGERSGDACDHYTRYAEDFRLAARLGHAVVKISVEWSRIEREPGVFDEGELVHYEDVVRTMCDLGLRPIVALHHFTNPLWLEEHGWWEGARTPELFARFVRVVAERLGPWVDTWITINEPMLVVSAGYKWGFWPPERRGWLSARRAARNLVRAHNLAYDAVHDVAGICRVGPAVNVTALRPPGRPTIADRVLASPLDWLANYYFMDRVRERADFIGVQYYSRATVQQLLAGDPLAVPKSARRLPRSDLGWEIYPKGIYYTVRSMWRRFGLPIIVTENGIADAEDCKRADFIKDHLAWLHRAIGEGADVRGYLHWALLDNFEWREGFAPRFGLVAVDYETQERVVRDSARLFARICRDNAVPVPAKDVV